MADHTVSLLKGSLDLLILRALVTRPAHGYGVIKWLEEATGSALQIEEGSVYPALYRLENRGWVTSDWGASENNRRARYYRLTPKGRAQLRIETIEFTRFAQAVFQALESPLKGPAL